MPSRSPIPLFPQPPFSPQGGPPSDESDFPPIRIREDVNHELAADNLPVGEHVDLPSEESDFPPIRIHEDVNHESALRPLPVSEHVDLPSDDLDFLPIYEHASTPDPPRCSRLPKKGLGRKNILNNIHTDAQQSKALKRKRSEFTQERPPKRQRLAFNKTDMDWLKGELHDIKFEIGEIRTSMMGIADRLRNEEDFRLEHILYPI